MNILFLLGRVLFSFFFLNSAYGHLTKIEMMAGYTGSKGVPAPKLAVIVTGILLLIGGLSILFGVGIYWGIGALLLFLLPVAFIMHPYWKESDPMQRSAQQKNFMRNMSLSGALLMFLLIPMPWPYSL